MKLIDSSYEILEQESGLSGVFKAITEAGYTCYKTNKEITDESAKKFVNDVLIKSNHGAMLEHGTVYLKWDMVTEDYAHSRYYRYKLNKYSVVKTYEDDTYAYITTNYRVLVENGWLDDLAYEAVYEPKFERRISVRFICDRGVSHELVRHRVFSFAMESTRYCNYSNDKFGNQLTFIIPSWYNEYNDTGFTHNSRSVVFAVMCEESERQYFSLLDRGLKPQEARQVLPISIKTEIVMTGFVSDWEHFFDLRTSIASTGQPHPDMKKLADPLYREFIERGYIKRPSSETIR